MQTNVPSNQIWGKVAMSTYSNTLLYQRQNIFISGTHSSSNEGNIFIQAHALAIFHINTFHIIDTYKVHTDRVDKKRTPNISFLSQPQETFTYLNLAPRQYIGLMALHLYITLNLGTFRKTNRSNTKTFASEQS